MDKGPGSLIDPHNVDLPASIGACVTSPPCASGLCSGAAPSVPRVPWLPADPIGDLDASAAADSETLSRGRAGFRRTLGHLSRTRPHAAADTTRPFGAAGDLRKARVARVNYRRAKAAGSGGAAARKQIDAYRAGR